MVTACAFSMMKISTTMRTTAPAINAVCAAPIRLLGRGPGAQRARVRAAGADGVGLVAVGAGAAPLGEAGVGGKVAACGAGSVMALLPPQTGNRIKSNPAIRC